MNFLRNKFFSKPKRTRDDSNFVQAEVYDYGQVIGVSFPVHASSVSIHGEFSTAVAYPELEKQDCFEVLSTEALENDEDECLLQVPAKAFSIADHETTNLDDKIFEDDVGEAVFVEAIFTPVESEKDIVPPQLSDFSPKIPEVSIEIIDEHNEMNESLPDEGLRTRCTSSGSHDSQFFMDVIDILRKNSGHLDITDEMDHQNTAIPSANNFHNTLFTSNVHIDDIHHKNNNNNDNNDDIISVHPDKSELVISEAEELERILFDVMSVRIRSSSFGESTVIDDSVFDCIERDIECISLDDSPSETVHVMERKEEKEEDEADEECCDSYQDMAKQIEQLNCMSQRLLHSLKSHENHLNIDGNTHINNENNSNLQIIRTEEVGNGSGEGWVQCVVDSNADSNASLVLSVPASCNTPCHVILNQDSDTSTLSNATNMLVLVALDEQKPREVVTENVLALEPRKLATSKRIRDGGKFRRVQTKWVSATDFFAPRKAEEGNNPTFEGCSLLPKRKNYYKRKKPSKESTSSVSICQG
mmetsp:Transcript_27742/g.39392  ORF Transcript_27742/g.39392 Transcript_27742/m.39392 type:complete len:530 (+) Transcript_27742:39-1628(+)